MAQFGEGGLGARIVSEAAGDGAQAVIAWLWQVKWLLRGVRQLVNRDLEQTFGPVCGQRVRFGEPQEGLAEQWAGLVDAGVRAQQLTKLGRYRDNPGVGLGEHPNRVLAARRNPGHLMKWRYPDAFGRGHGEGTGRGIGQLPKGMGVLGKIEVVVNPAAASRHFGIWAGGWGLAGFGHHRSVYRWQGR
ncbi:MAG: hypothetical protein LBH68_03010 [Bifidobacteriaceae bacterium]|nr:hypothetical protein [Bifidobacteriaceae bacterium]